MQNPRDLLIEKVEVAIGSTGEQIPSWRCIMHEAEYTFDVAIPCVYHKE